MEQIPLIWDGKQCGIYCIRNLKNGKVYIGSSKNCYHRVRSQHFDKLQRGTHHNPYLQSSWKKYGKSCFESFCVEICQSDVLEEREQMWIDKTKCLDPKEGYNINLYADRVELTPEQRKKISLGKIGNSYTKGKMSGVRRVVNRKGNVTWMVILSFSNKDIYAGTFDSKNMADQVQKHMIQCFKNNKDIDWSWINKHRMIHKKLVVQKRMDGKLVCVYESIVKASNVVKCDRQGIRFCCQGKKDSYRGFLWEYAK